MTIAIVQSKAFFGPWTGSFNSNVTAGNTVFLFGFQYNGASMSSNSPQFNGATPAGSVKLFDGQNAAGGFVYGSCWMMPNLAGGAASVALTGTGGTIDGNVGMIAMEASGLGTAPQLDSGAAPNPKTGSGSTGTVTSGATGNITSAPELILGAGVASGQVIGIPAAPWAGLAVGGVGNCTAAWQVVTSSGSPYTFTAPNAVTVGWFAGVCAVQLAPPPAVAAVLGGSSMFARSMRWADL